MRLFDLLYKIIRKCKIRTTRDGEWRVTTYPDGSWRATRTAHDDIGPSGWSAWGSLYYAKLFNWEFPSSCQNPKFCKVQSYDSGGSTWITLKDYSSKGLNGIYAITPLSKSSSHRVYLTIEIEGGY